MLPTCRLQAEAVKLYVDEVLPSMIGRHDAGGSRAARANNKQTVAVTVNSKAASAIKKPLEKGFGVGGASLRSMNIK